MILWIVKLIKRMRAFVSSGILSEKLDNPLARQQHKAKASIDSISVQPDTYNVEARKRVAAEFAQQQKAMQARALKKHSTACKDPLTCTKNKCFIVEPDKIIRKRRVKRRITVGLLNKD